MKTVKKRESFWIITIENCQTVRIKKESDSGWVNRGRCRNNDNRKTSVKMKPKWKEK